VRVSERVSYQKTCVLSVHELCSRSHAEGGPGLRFADVYLLPARFSKLITSRASWPRLVACGRVSGGSDGVVEVGVNTFHFVPLSTVISKDMHITS
jgi:hypothetical protein